MSGSARAPVLIAGISVRALAESAARAGENVIALDAYGDLDLRRIAQVVTVARRANRRFEPMRVARVSRDIDAAVVTYASSFENSPSAVQTLARERTLIGNPPAVLRRVRDPVTLARVLPLLGVHTPAVRASAPPVSDDRQWLLKPRRSGGGHGIARWSRGIAVPRTSIVQERVRGSAGSIIFIADGARIIPLALTRQLSGDPAFGARGFAYCGSILEPHRPELFASACALATAVVREFALRGVCGIDFIARGTIPYVIEVNPRPTASMELVERATGASIWLAHVAGCTSTLSAWPAGAVRSPALVHGKAVLHARGPIVLGDTAHWLADDDVRDVPAPGERIAQGSPICTIFASGRTSALCYDALVRRARTRFAEVEGRMRRKSA